MMQYHLGYNDCFQGRSTILQGETPQNWLRLSKKSWQLLPDRFFLPMLAQR